jgi:hypothetical protein
MHFVTRPGKVLPPVGNAKIEVLYQLVTPSDDRSEIRKMWRIQQEKPILVITQTSRERAPSVQYLCAESVRRTSKKPLFFGKHAVGLRFCFTVRQDLPENAQ